MIATPSSRHIGILDFRQKSKDQFGDREIGWFTAAANEFCRKHLKRLYPEDPVWTVEYYTSISQISLTDIWPMALLDDDGSDASLGRHYVRWGLIGAAVDCLGLPLDEILSILLHELEMCFNPFLNEWPQLPDGRKTPREAGDPVQWSKFDFEVSQTMFGVSQTRSFRVQNMVGARYWGELAGIDSVPFDLKGEVSRAHQWPLRGYRVIKDGSRRYNEFGQGADGLVMGSRKFGPGSRTWSLLRGEVPQLHHTADGAYVASFEGRHFSGTTAVSALEQCRKYLVSPPAHVEE